MLHIWESNYFFTDPSPIIVLYLQKLSFAWSIHSRRCWDLNVVTLAVEDANFALDCYVWSRFWSWSLVMIFKLKLSWEVYRFWSCLVKISLVSGHLCCNKLFRHFGNFVRVTGISFLEVPFTTLISFSAESGEGQEERRQDCQRQVLLIKSCFSSWSWPGLLVGNPFLVFARPNRWHIFATIRHLFESQTEFTTPFGESLLLNR